MALEQSSTTVPVMSQTFVALDLETTGLDADRERIIQVGAVKFQGDAVLQHFETFVNPGRAIPDFIQRLTGIRPEQVSRAPHFSSVSQGIEEFVADHPVIGHNVNFDLRFLETHGLKLDNTRYDTWDLASILLPRTSEYSLGSLARRFGLEHERAHQAIDDADATRQLFVTLLREAQKLDPALLKYLLYLANRSNWTVANLLGGLESDAATNGKDSESPPLFGLTGLDYNRLSARLGRPERRRFDENLNHLTEDKVSGLLSPGGPFDKTFEGFEIREQQVEMLGSVTRAMYGGEKLIVEGGTGVGKSMAYLLPAALFAASRGLRVVISTNTINLQEQLMRKDIPAVIKVLEESGLVEQGLIKATQLKGRSNYLCLRRWNYLANNDGPSVDDTRLLGKTAVWLQDTVEGDRAEINLSGRDYFTWNKVSAGERGGCPGLRSNSSACFLRSARERAEQAHIVVVNHALLLSDVAYGGSIIPDYQHLIIDEAHNLEEEATRQFGFQLTPDILGEVNDLLSRLARETRLTLNSLEFKDAIRQNGEALVSQADEMVPRLRQNWSEMWAATLRFFRAQDGNNEDFLISPRSRSQRSWAEVNTSWENVDVGLSNLSQALGKLQSFIYETEFPGSGDEGSGASTTGNQTSLLSECSAIQGNLDKVREQLSSVISKDDPLQIHWLKLDQSKDEVSLNSAPLEVGPTLRQQLFDEKESVILTSATLSAQGTFDYSRRRLDLPEDSQELLVGSPFDYRKAALLMVPEDMPQPQTEGYIEGVSRAIVDISTHLSGRTMALFTSHSALRNVANRIRNRLEQQGIEVLAQGVDGGPTQVSRRFIENPKSVLLGTSSFWEGVDFPGGVLRALIITRLPFQVPTDPVVKARSDQYENAFNEFSIPQAVLRFRQGMGRLIRNKGDSGAIVVLDKRITGRNYGQAFLHSIPPCTLKPSSLSNLGIQAAEWIEEADRGTAR
ncbi:MAG: exonuclease domain-containing protein [Chloroflexi bacterium]|nr:exonuclease domain-containing protein [Chloroflexota bacterium]